MNGANENEKLMISTLLGVIGEHIATPTREFIESKAKQLAPILNYTGDLPYIIETVLTKIDTRIGAGDIIEDPSVAHDKDWPFKKDMEWVYFNAYSEYLRSEGWPEAAIQSIADSSLRLLGLLKNPEEAGSWKRRGLTIGHVQSGKTSNYLGLISRAADAGYKFIIVVAGVHNNLRRQTQERIEEGFIGRSTNPENGKKIIGVAKWIHQYPHPVTFTTVINDFNTHNANTIVSGISDFNKPIILVIKKHVTVLRSLYEWLEKYNAKNGQIVDMPVVMIDDEADNASINTNKDEISPTKTNSWIRRILSLFAKSCYIGYTATPFANIFINPDAYDDEAREDLFPRDFIYALDAPNTYFGPSKVFRDDAGEDKYLRIIEDCGDCIPLGHKGTLFVQELPPGLLQAFNIFILSKAIRNLKGQRNKHSSMLINVSQFVSVQNQVKYLLVDYEKRLRQAIKANYRLPEAFSSQDTYMINLRNLFKTEFLNCGYVWNDVKAELYQSFDTLRIFVINNRSTDNLDYKSYEKSGKGLTAVAIGGFSLSRGLTLEGLCTSYMYRNTKTCDTLMQMGRWFGYRTGYEDLCRICLSQESISWYGYISDITDDLRNQIRIMQKDGLSPKEFGLYIKRHPDALRITSANKMRHAVSQDLHISYCGKLRESYQFSPNPEVHKKNEELIIYYCRNRFGIPWEQEKGGLFGKDVDTKLIYKFISDFQVEDSWANEKNNILNFLEEIFEVFPKGDVILISPTTRGGNMSQFKAATQRRTVSWHNKAWETSKGRVASRGDERIGLTPEQIEKAEELASNDSKSEPGNPSDAHYRRVREKPLLMLHVLQLQQQNKNDVHRATDKKIVIERAPTFGISFPYGDYSTTISVDANQVWVDNPQVSEGLDYPEDDSDD